MHDIITSLASLLHHQQLAPLVVLFLFPLLVLFFFQTLRRISLRPATIIMVLETFGFTFPWSWGSGQSGSSSPHDSKKLRKKHIRSRAEHHELNGYGRPGASTNCGQPIALNTTVEGRTGPPEGYYPGLVNISGTYCFMNSTLQARPCSPVYIHPYLTQPRRQWHPCPTYNPISSLSTRKLYGSTCPHLSLTPFSSLSMVRCNTHPAPSTHLPMLQTSTHHGHHTILYAPSRS